jgi:hypothetical protein
LVRAITASARRFAANAAWAPSRIAVVNHPIEQRVTKHATTPGTTGTRLVARFVRRFKPGSHVKRAAVNLSQTGIQGVRPGMRGYFGFLGGSAGLVMPHGSYFSLEFGIRSNAAL